MAMMKGVSFLLMTITSLILLSSSISSAREFESPPLNPQVEQGKFVGKLLNCGSVLFFRGWSCWHDFLTNKNTVPCCTALVDSMDCPFEIIPEDERQSVKDYCGEVIKNSDSNAAVFGPVSSPVRFVDLVKNMEVQVHENGEN